MPKKKPKPGPVPKEAIDFFKAKGIKPGFSYLDVWREEHDTAFTVAKIMEKDILIDVQDSLARALEEGAPYQQWVKGTRETFDRSGWTAYGAGRDRPRRLNVIYDTNQRSARAVGQWGRVERTKRTRPFLRYALGPSERHRPHHAAWDGTTLPVDDPWWGDHMPQNGYLCKCHVIQESRAVVERRGGPSEKAPPSPKVAWKNPKTGKIEYTPQGIDPGFAHNPGQARARAQTLSKIEAESEAALKKSRKALDDITGG